MPQQVHFGDKGGKQAFSAQLKGEKKIRKADLPKNVNLRNHSCGDQLS